MSTYMRWNLVFGCLIVVNVVLILSGGRDHSQTNVEYMPDMAYSIPAQTFQASEALASGQTLQAPPLGTIPRGRMPLGFGPGESEAIRAGFSLKAPQDLSADNMVAEGARKFATFCQPCHGAQGAGDGVVAQRGFPPPPSLVAPHAKDLPDGRIFHIITYGQGNMPAHGSQVDQESRWAIVARIRELQSRKAEVAESKVDQEGDR